MELHKGEAYDAVQDVKTAVKHINGLTYKKRALVRQAGPNTRAKEMIDDIRKRRDASIEKYTFSRKAMINLGSTQTGPKDEFPELTVADAAMKYVEQPHALGDGSKVMAAIWHAGGKKKVSNNKTTTSMSMCWHTHTTHYLDRFRWHKQSYSPKSHVPEGGQLDMADLTNRYYIR